MSPPAVDPSAGLSLDEAAKVILTAFAGTAPPASGWVEVRVNLDGDGHWPTSYALEAELRFQAKKAFHGLDLTKVQAELVWLQAGQPARMQAGGIYKRTGSRKEYDYLPTDE